MRRLRRRRKWRQSKKREAVLPWAGDNINNPEQDRYQLESSRYFRHPIPPVERLPDGHGPVRIFVKDGRPCF